MKTQRFEIVRLSTAIPFTPIPLVFKESTAEIFPFFFSGEPSFTATVDKDTEAVITYTPTKGFQVSNAEYFYDKIVKIEGKIAISSLTCNYPK